MQFTTDELSALIGAYVWPFFRIAAVLAVAPVFSITSAPMQIRLLVAVALTVLIAPTVPAVPQVEPLSVPGLLTMGQQVLLGLAMGFTLRLVFSAMITAGQVTSMGMGLGFAAIVDPSNGVQVPVLSQFYNIVGILLFLAFNGHLVLFKVLAESFHSLPVGPEGIALQSLWDLVAWGSWIFAGAVLIALPAVASILVVNISFGVMTRAAPQLNIFAVGFPIMMTLGFSVVFLTLPNAVENFTHLIDQAFGLMRTVGTARG